MARYLKSSPSARAPVASGGPSGSLPEAPLGGTKGEAMRRLQMGTIGVIAVLLLIGLASIIKDRAAQTDTTTVAGAAATSGTSETPPAKADPLAEAGMVPEIPASTSEAVPPAASRQLGGAASSSTDQGAR